MTIFGVISKKLQNFAKKPNNFFNNQQTCWRVSSKKLCVLSLVYNSTTPLFAVFVWGFKVKNRQLDWKTFEVDKVEFPTRQ